MTRQEFLEELAKLPANWISNMTGHIRTLDHQCPITALSNAKGDSSGENEWEIAAEHIGLDYIDACAIVASADQRVRDDCYDPWLREALVAATVRRKRA